MTSAQNSGEARIEIVPYDPEWPSLFEQERSRLETALRQWLAGPIEHVGSTAVPGLAAKPVIDIMAGVESLAASVDAIAAAGQLGYLHYPYRPDVMHWFCKPSAAFRTHHLHLVPVASQLWKERLAFRDYLRRDAATAADYATLKMELARQYECDREAYTDAKGPFVRRIVERALSSASRG
jgi:GrpB-like predicted nucleotidyltransferase (UPF0157 family)